MLQGRDQLGERGQAFCRKAVAQGSRCPVGPTNRQGHPPRRTSLTNEHPFRSRAPPFEDDLQPLARQRVERMGDNDRVRNRTRPG